MDILFEQHDFVIETERRIRALEQFCPPINRACREWTMWLELDRVPNHLTTPLCLSQVVYQSDWEQFLELRTEIEIPFGITDTVVLEKIINDIRLKCEQLNGSWYIARVGDETVGAIGIVPFPCKIGAIGRLQDVDILPKYQGQGLGRQLLVEICRLARLKGLIALCLMAKENDWPKDWYKRFGFIKVGEIGVE